MSFEYEPSSEPLQVYYGCYETCTPGEIAVVAEHFGNGIYYITIILL